MVRVVFYLGCLNLKGLVIMISQKNELKSAFLEEIRILHYQIEKKNTNLNSILVPRGRRQVRNGGRGF
jgi:hypothetical protein